MRISSQFARTLQSVANRLVRELGKREDTELTDPVEQLIVSILATDGAVRKARAALRRLGEEMIDFNELRVTPATEVAGLLGPYVRDPYEKAQAVITALGWVVTRFDTLDLSGLRSKSQAELRTIFAAIPGCPEHARDAMLLLSFGVAVFPVDHQMVEYLQAQEAMPEGVEPTEVASYVERHFKAAELREFYLNVKEASEHEGGTRKKNSPESKKGSPRGGKR